MSADLCIDALAARQHGVINRQQALACGLTRHQIQRRIAGGKWITLDSRVYALRSAPATWHRQLQGALLSRPVAVAAGRSAGFLHGFPWLRRGRPEILVPFPGNARSPIAKVIRSRHFDLITTTMIDGFRVTTVAETILTLSFRETYGFIERLVDDRLACGRLRIPDFDPILERLAGARMKGLPALRSIVISRDSAAYQPPVSELERLLYELLGSPEIPPYEHQLPIAFPALEAVVDAYIPSWRMIIEGDGRRWHTRKADFEADRRRDNAAAGAGIVVLRFTYRMLADQPGLCLKTILDAGRWRQSA